MVMSDGTAQQVTLTSVCNGSVNVSPLATVVEHVAPDLAAPFSYIDAVTTPAADATPVTVASIE